MVFGAIKAIQVPIGTAYANFLNSLKRNDI